MKYVLVLLMVFINHIAFAQNDSITLDQLQVPSSPAFNILDISPNSVDRPKNPTDFALALSNATSGFSTFPKNFAIEFAPFWIFGKKKATYDDFVIDKPGKNIIQTTTFSLGTKDAESIVDSSEFRKVAFAFKFSIFRGNLGTDFRTWSDSVYKYLGRISMLEGQPFATIIQSDRLLISLLDSLNKQSKIDSLNGVSNSIEKSRLQIAIAKRNTELKENVKKIAQDSIEGYSHFVGVLKGLMSRADFRRYGFKMDYAIGTAVDYPDSNFTSSYVSKISTWLTLGYEYERSLNWLGVIRYNHNINRFYRNTANALVNDINIGELDYGLRVYSDVTSKFTLSFEILQRRRIFNKSKLNDNSIKLRESTDRYVFSANYKVGKNQNLAFTYGKNFDNTMVKEGNLLAALNFLIGFGSIRPLVHSPN